MDQPRNRHERDDARRIGVGFSLDRFYRLNRRALIWLSLAFLLWLLRPFFSLIFLTFVFAFIAAPMADFLARWLRLNRHVAICLTFGLFVAAISTVSVFVVPQVARETFVLVKNLPKTEERLLELRKDIIEKYPGVEPILMNYLRSTIPDTVLTEMGQRDASASAALGLSGPSLTRDEAQAADEAERELLRAARNDEAIIHLFFSHQIEKLTAAAPGVIRMMWAASATVLLALLFSFLISLDLSRLGQEVRNLQASRLRDFHQEVAQPVVRFAYVVGRAIQAQGMIALVNTLLTLIGLMLLGIPSLAVLSMVVFLCSFIPVLGVFLSTTPIVLVALNAGGLNLAVLSVVMVIIIHAVEAYMLNPLIYGKHLKLNPVLVLIILFIGHHAFGVWGMLLGVPVAHYFIHDVFGVPIWNKEHLESKRLFARRERVTEKSDQATSEARPVEP